MSNVDLASYDADKALTAAKYKQDKVLESYTNDECAALRDLGISRYVTAWHESDESYRIKATYDYYGHTRTYSKVVSEKGLINSISNGEMFADRTFVGAMRQMERRYANALNVAAEKVEQPFSDLLQAIANRCMANYANLGKYMDCTDK